jgi:hypothetical protein
MYAVKIFFGGSRRKTLMTCPGRLNDDNFLNSGFSSVRSSLMGSGGKFNDINWQSVPVLQGVQKDV